MELTERRRQEVDDPRVLEWIDELDGKLLERRMEEAAKKACKN